MSAISELATDIKSLATNQTAILEFMKQAQRPVYGAEGLLSTEARKGGRIITGSDGSVQLEGALWKKGIGMGKDLAAMHKAALTNDMERSATVMKAMGWTKSALQATGGATGGWTVPPQFVSRLLQLVFEDSVAMPLAAVQPMDSRTMDLPSLDVTTRYSTGQSPFLGGVVARWTEEAVDETETDPQFRQVTLTARELSGWTAASNSLLADNAVGLDALLSQLFTYAINWYSDYAFIQGDGVGKPQGILRSPATIFVTAGTAGTVVFADVAAMYGSLLPQSHKKAVWLASPSAIQYLLQLKDGASNNIFQPRPTAPSAGGGAQAAPVWELLGRPVIITEKMPLMATGSAVNQGFALIDWSLYLIGVRMEVEIATSPHYKFISNQSVWRFVARMDGRPWLDNSVRLQDGTTALSPFVWLRNA